MDINMVLFKKDGGLKSFPVKRSIVTIGRSHNCDFQIPVMSVSKKHCKLICKSGVVTIRDLNSRNGTLVNGKLIKETTINPGDSIEIGPLVFVIQIDNEPSVLKNPKLPENEKLLSKKAEDLPPKTEDSSEEGKQNIPLSDLETEDIPADDLVEGSDFLDLDELGDLSDLEELK